MANLATRTLGDLVAEAPDRAAVLDRLGLDYCCHGQRSLADACTSAGLDPAEVVPQIETAGVTAPSGYPQDPAGLTSYIEATHHAFLHTELPELKALAAKVAGVHGERHAELSDVARLVDALEADLEPHMAKEERVLFPAIRALAGGPAGFPFGTIRNPIRMMMMEHDAAGDLLAELRELTGGYHVPEDGCASYRALYTRLAHLESDTHRHIHLENNVLFPAAVALEQR